MCGRYSISSGHVYVKEEVDCEFEKTDRWHRSCKFLDYISEMCRYQSKEIEK
jgi:hypothetical protein